MALAQLSASFQSLPLLTTSKLGPSGADSRVHGFVYILEPHGSLQRTLLWGWKFLLPQQPPRVLTVRGFEGFFSHARTLGCAVCLARQLSLPVYPQANVGPPGLPATASSTQSSSHSPLHPGCSSPPLLPVWMNVSSLTHSLVVRLPYSLIFWQFWLFLFLNSLLSFFWLCKEANCIYLHLHLSRKSGFFFN